MNVSVRSAIDEYCRHIHSSRSEQLAQAYCQALSAFQLVLGKESKQDLLTKDIRILNDQALQLVSFFLEYLQENRAIETEHLYTRALLDFLTYTKQQTWIDIDLPAIHNYLSANRRAKSHEVTMPPVELIQQVIDHVRLSPPTITPESKERDIMRSYRDRAFLLTLAETGMRVTEICNLRKYQANLDQRVLILSPELSFPLSASTTEAIRTYLKSRRKLDDNQSLLSPEHLPLFARHDKRAGKKVLAISRWTGNNIIDFWVKQALPSDVLNQLEKDNTSISPQSFRHYFVIHTLQSTDDLDKTQQLARHTDPMTTRRYRALLEQEPGDQD